MLPVDPEDRRQLDRGDGRCGRRRRCIRRRAANQAALSAFLANAGLAPVAGGKFAIIDGQHRATAAALIGIETVPAQVIVADRIEQASAFKSINGQVTRVNKLALHHAAVAAGDAEARELGWPCVGAQAACFGRIIARGNHAELLAANGRYASMWALQQSGESVS